jgi:phage gpG-like protein
MADSGLFLSDWKGEELNKLLASTLNKKLTTIGILLVNELKAELVARDNPTPPGTNASDPGEPPAKVKGRLSASITKNVDTKNHVLTVGTPLLYGKFLELGHRSRDPEIFVAARPWLRPVAHKNEKIIEKIIQG